MSDRFPQYTTDYISGVMSLRKPQETSLKILEEILSPVNLRKGLNLKAALGSVHAMYPICTDFEREFICSRHRRGQNPADGGVHYLSIHTT